MKIERAHAMLELCKFMEADIHVKKLNGNSDSCFKGACGYSWAFMGTVWHFNLFLGTPTVSVDRSQASPLQSWQDMSFEPCHFQSRRTARANTQHTI